jgi:zinc protease
MQEVTQLRETPLTPGQVTRVRDVMLRQIDKNMQENGYLIAQISRRYEEGDAANVGAVFARPKRISALSGDAIQLAAQKYLDTGNYIEVTLKPQQQ